jgi:transcriptional regulator with XRE-family HTH domain
VARHLELVDPAVVEALRKARYPRQADFAAAAGIDQASASRLERGPGPYERETVEKAAAALGVPVERLLAPRRPVGDVAEDDPEIEALVREAGVLSPAGRALVRSYLRFVLDQEKRRPRKREPLACG